MSLLSNRKRDKRVSCECGTCPKCVNRERVRAARAAQKIADGLQPHERRLRHSDESKMVFHGEWPRVRLTLSPLDVLGMRGTLYDCD